MQTHEHSDHIKYLKLLARQYPSVDAVSAAIIKNHAVLNLPKGTEHFISDVHGQHESFLHILKNSSGVIKQKVHDLFANTLTKKERAILCTLIYYPKEKLALIEQEMGKQDLCEWYRLTLHRLLEVCRVITSKYTRSRIRDSLPEDFGSIIDELLQLRDDHENKQEYYNRILSSIIEIDRSQAFIVALSRVIQGLAIDHMHILGDIYDRGPRADLILDALLPLPRVDIQWGNHDILWMGAAAGSDVCIMGVLRITIQYNNLDMLEDGYGISLRPLINFAMAVYGDDPCTPFLPRDMGDERLMGEPRALNAKLHKAVAILQCKLEGQTIARNPSFGMQDRAILKDIYVSRGMMRANGQDIPLTDSFFPTLDEVNPYALTCEEQEVVSRMRLSFLHSSKLQEHVRFLFAKGSLYTCHNGNLLFHGCIPMEEDGRFSHVQIGDEMLCGKALMDAAQSLARQGFFSKDEIQAQRGQDFMWYLSCGPKSPLFGKDRMTTFERYFTKDESLYLEKKDAYYLHIEQEKTCIRILQEFSLSPDGGHIINGHVPVKIVQGEKPVKAGGKLLVIDGGLSKAYQKVTGIAGYTLIATSHALLLAAHEPFESVADAIEQERDLHSTLENLETFPSRQMVLDTDAGKELLAQTRDLEMLLAAYRHGLLRVHL